MLKSEPHREIINTLKRIFDENGVKRLHLEDDFFLELINTVETKNTSISSINHHIEDAKEIKYRDIKDIKMEYMINIEGILSSIKGKTTLNRYSFGLDIRRIPLKVFLTEIKVLLRNRTFEKKDIIVFYDDTATRFGNRGFAITRDEVITNINGIFKVISFEDMTNEPEFVIGHKKDAFRMHFDNSNFDVKVNKKVKYTDVAYDVFKLLYLYAQESKKEE